MQLHHVTTSCNYIRTRRSPTHRQYEEAWRKWQYRKSEARKSKVKSSQFKSFFLGWGVSSPDDRKDDPPLDMLELRGLLQAIGLSDEDAEAALVGIDANGDGLIQLSEWEQGLTPAMRSAIEAHLDEMDNLSS